ncbi:MAG: AraC family transcriptional regulator [Oscillospiraceae bacterium]|nr:AraC family transcriptional regulator [Oscillospiraceae bacterium]
MSGRFEREFSFEEKLLKNKGIQTLRVARGETAEFDHGLRRMLHVSSQYNSSFDVIREKTLYYACDALACCYCFLKMPDADVVFLVGPYLGDRMDDNEIMALLERQHLSPALLPSLRLYYSSLCAADNAGVMDVLMGTLADTIWESADGYEIIRTDMDELLTEAAAPQYANAADAFNAQMLEKRYEQEGLLIQFVSKGMTRSALKLIAGAHQNAVEQRVADPIRNSKNYAIILNTLLRKAAQQGGVHPLYIDRISSEYARRIETVHTASEMVRTTEAMVEGYCTLVRERTLAQYSPLVRRVILRIDADLTADLSLSAHARALSVNASYLSDRFSKETGMPLTEYVVRSRVKHAVYLLGATDMQIQTIAQYCGMTDSNYFTKVFKKVTGKTPLQMRAGRKQRAAG